MGDDGSSRKLMLGFSSFWMCVPEFCWISIVMVTGSCSRNSLTCQWYSKNVQALVAKATRFLLIKVVETWLSWKSTMLTARMRMVTNVNGDKAEDRVKHHHLSGYVFNLHTDLAERYTRQNQRKNVTVVPWPRWVVLLAAVPTSWPGCPVRPASWVPPKTTDLTYLLSSEKFLHTPCCPGPPGQNTALEHKLKAAESKLSQWRSPQPAAWLCSFHEQSRVLSPEQRYKGTRWSWHSHASQSSPQFLPKQQHSTELWGSKCPLLIQWCKCQSYVDPGSVPPGKCPSWSQWRW